MVRRCLVCGQVPSLEYTFPKNMDEAIKWQSMLSVHVSAETLRNNSCVCNKHFNHSPHFCNQAKQKKSIEQRRVSFERESIHFSEDISSSSNVSSGQLRLVRKKDKYTNFLAVPQRSQGIYSSETNSEDVSIRKDSGCDTCSSSVSTKPSCCPIIPAKNPENQNKMNSDFVPSTSPAMGIGTNLFSPTARPMEIPHHNSPPQFLRASPCMCMPGINDDPQRDPVNVLIMAGCMLPTYYNSMSSKARSPETEICVLESNLGNEKIIFKDIDVPKFTVCRTPTGETLKDVKVAKGDVRQKESSTEVLLMGLTENESVSCLHSSDKNPLNMETDKKSNPPQPMQNQNGNIDDLEALLVQQQELLKSIQAKLNDMHRMNNENKLENHFPGKRHDNKFDKR